MTALLVVLGGALGAPARYLLDRAVQARHGSPFPHGTLLVNVLGSLLLGVLLALQAEARSPSWVLTLLGTGFCGAFTTFSTFGLDTVRLLEQGRASLALRYVAASVVVSLGAAALGWTAVSAVA